MPEHTPLTDRDIGNIQELFRGIPLLTVVNELIAEIRESRRLLRAVEWTDCNLSVDEHKEVESYLASCAGKKDG